MTFYVIITNDILSDISSIILLPLYRIVK